jgi:hypothetical protein
LTNFPKHPGRHAPDHGIRFDIARYYRTSGNHSTLPDADAIGDNGTSSYPYIIFDDNPLGRYPLVDKRAIPIVEDMIYGNNLDKGRGVNPIADFDPSLSPDHRILADKAIASDFYARMGDIPEIIDVENRPMHDDGI